MWATTVPFTDTSPVGDADAWAGYVEEQQAILKFVKEEKIAPLVIVSGDRHAAAAIEIAENVWELSASPLDGKHSFFRFDY